MSMDTGAADLAAAVRAGRYPSDADLAALDEQASAAAQHAAALGAAATRAAHHHRPRLADALKGSTGDAQVAEVTAQASRWCAHADDHELARTAVENAASELRGLRYDLDLLIEAAEPQYNAALRLGKTTAAQGILAATLAEADGMVTERSAAATGHITAVSFSTAPAPRRPSTDTSIGGGSDASRKHGKQSDDAAEAGKGDASGEPAEESGAGKRDIKVDAAATNGDAQPREIRSDTALTQPGMPVTPTQARAASGSGGGMPSGLGSSLGPAGPGSLGSGMGSGLNPGSLSSGLGSVSTSPASAGSSFGSSMPSPLADAGAGFQSGLASGMGSSGGVAGPVSPPMSQQPLAPFSSQQPMVAAPQAGGAGNSAGVPPAVPGASQPAGVVGSGGGFGAPGGVAGGGGMVPPAGAMAAGQPLAPYSPPGAGAPAGTAMGPAGAGGPGPGPVGGSGSAPGGSPTPVMAGGSGTSAAMASAAATTEDTNPDITTAQRVLAGLVRGSEASDMLIVWAVAVLRSPYGSQIMVANNMGGGGYLPSKVFLPTTAHLAVSDPALPIGWAADWMGCQRPSKILADHFSRLCKLVAGVSVSAMVTTELWPDPPGCGGDFVAMQHRNVLGMLSQAPRLDGGHRHRLAVLDQGLAQRVGALDRGGDVSAWAAATLTGTVFKEAAKPDGTGSALVHAADADILQAVNGGTADAEVWATYDRAAEQRDNGAAMWPDTHAPRDNDGSEAARAAILWYQHYYRAGRMIELVRCWKARPPRLAEVVYCAITAGFSSQVVATLAAMEHHLGEKKGVGISA